MIISPIIEAEFEPKLALVDRLAKFGDELRISHVIEFGCGHGKDASLLQDRTGWDVLATDRSGEMMVGIPNTVSRALLDAAQPLPPEMIGKFQLAYCAFLLHLLPLEHRRSFFLNCFSCLEPSGVFACLTASEEDLERRFLAKYFPTALRIDIERYRTVEENLRVLKDVGFIDVSAEQLTLGAVRIDLDFYQRRLSSIMRLLPADEYRDGMERMEADLRGHEQPPTREWRRTMLVARRGKHDG